MRVLVAVLLSVASQGAGTAQGPTALRESFDLQVPSAPAPVTVSGKVQLVYELHLTNFAADRLALTHIEVRDPDRQILLAEYRDEHLRAVVGCPGRTPGSGDNRTVGSGMRGVVYFWVTLDEASGIPRRVTHRVRFDILRPAGREAAAVEGATVVVRSEMPAALDPPVRGGPWAAVYDPAMERGHRRVIYAVGGRARIPARFAIDWIKVDDRGRSAAGDTSKVENWYGYGADVLAVADSVVADVRDGVAENASLSGPSRPRQPLGGGSGNYVSLDLGGGRYAFYEHLKPGSIRVRIGDRVKSGQVIAALGNTGDTGGPHLHFHLSDANATLAAEGLPYVFRRFELLGAFESIEAFGKGQPWQRRPPATTGTRVMELPAANTVLAFGSE